MSTMLPVISAAGIFESRDHFQGSVTRPRTVIDYELEIFTRDGGISHINGSSHPISKGCLLIAKPGDKRYSTLHFSAMFVHFGVRDPAVQQLLQDIAGFYPPAQDDRIEQLEQICSVALSLEPESELLAGALLTALLCRIKKTCLSPTRHAVGDAAYSAVSLSIEYMKQNFTQPLTVERIAQQCCISASHLHKLFAQTVHTTLANYLTQLRLAAAKELLRTTAMPISEVAAQCGFNSQAYFSDCFKRHFELSPRAYRSASRYPETESHYFEQNK